MIGTVGALAVVVAVLSSDEAPRWKLQGTMKETVGSLAVVVAVLLLVVQKYTVVVQKCMHQLAAREI